MTEQEILNQIEELNRKLEEVRKNKASVYSDVEIDSAEKERLHQEDLQRLRGLRLIDDDFMNACFDGYIEGAELLLRIILDKPDIRVKSVTTQRQMKNLLGRDICLDIDADDDSGKKYNIEVQRSDKGADRKRARYHSSILDAHLLKSGEDYSDLPETFVIFITENDVIGEGLPLYKIERKITNTGKSFDDGEHIIYVNGAYDNKDDTSDLAKLIHDFRCKKADEMVLTPFADIMKFLKETPKGVDRMCKIMEEREEERVKNEKIIIAANLLKLGSISREEIANATGLSLETINALAEELKGVPA